LLASIYLQKLFLGNVLRCFNVLYMTGFRRVHSPVEDISHEKAVAFERNIFLSQPSTRRLRGHRATRCDPTLNAHSPVSGQGHSSSPSSNHSSSVHRPQRHALSSTAAASIGDQSQRCLQTLSQAHVEAAVQHRSLVSELTQLVPNVSRNTWINTRIAVPFDVQELCPLFFTPSAMGHRLCRSC
jgi:hypothetical protein